MPKFAFKNLTDRTVRLGIEPWADVEVLAPDARVEFDYDEPAEVDFALLGDGVPVVSVMTDRLKVSGNGEERTHSPPSSWR